MTEILLGALTDLLRGAGLVACIVALGYLAAYLISWPSD